MAPVEAAPVAEDSASAEIENMLPDLTGKEISNVDKYVIHFSI